MRSPAGRIAIVAAAAAVLVLLFLLLRDTDEDGPAPQTGTTTVETTTAETTTAETTTAETTTATTTATPAGPRRFRILIRDGRVAGGRRTLRVERGDRLVLVVRADVSDHVHVHGYDRMADVGPGRPAQIGLRATVPGRFEIELEDRHLQIAELEVRP